MTASWVDYETLPADRAISSGVTVSAWTGNLDRALHQVGSIITSASQDEASGAVSKTLSTGGYALFREWPLWLRRKEDGEPMDYRVVYSTYPTTSASWIVRVQIGGTSYLGAERYRESTHIASATETVSTLVTDVRPEFDRFEWLTASSGETAGAEQFEMVWCTFWGKLVSGSDQVIALSSITVEEIP